MINFSQLIEDVNNEIESPYKALYQVKQLEKEIKEAKEILEGIAFEFSKYEDKNFISGDFKIEKRSGRKIWNFNNCLSYNKVKNKLKEVEEVLKSSYYASEKGLDMINKDAELIEIPKVTFTKDSLIIKKV